jgi:hypothetical protein
VTRFQKPFVSLGAFGAVALLIGACVRFDLPRLIPFVQPQETIVRNTNTFGLPITIHFCDPTSAYVSAATVQKNASSILQLLPPQFIGDRALLSIIDHAIYASLPANVETRRLILSGGSSNWGGSIIGPPPSPITQSDLLAFTQKLLPFALRQTPVYWASHYPYWDRFEQYYAAYFQNTFVDSFAHYIPSPNASLAIDDTEIANAAGVFVEWLLDELLTPTVWIGGDGFYYPGNDTGNNHQPTFVTVFGKPAKSFPNKDPFYGCKMNLFKAKAITYLATQFSKALAAETSSVTKSLGGFELGLGILGKVNIGDNSTVVTVTSSVMGLIARRLTVAYITPILEAIDIEPSANLISSRTSITDPEKIRVFTAPFYSGVRFTL